MFCDAKGRDPVGRAQLFRGVGDDRRENLKSEAFRKMQQLCVAEDLPVMRGACALRDGQRGRNT